MVGVVGGYVVGRLMRELSVVGFSCFGLWLWIVGCQWSSSVVLFSVVGFGRGWVGWVGWDVGFVSCWFLGSSSLVGVKDR